MIHTLYDRLDSNIYEFRRYYIQIKSLLQNLDLYSNVCKVLEKVTSPTTVNGDFSIFVLRMTIQIHELKKEKIITGIYLVP